MTADQINATSVLVTAVGTCITAIGIAVVAYMTARQKGTIKEIEKQGNSVSLELKRTNMVFAQRVATVTKSEPDMALAKDAKSAYDEAVKQIELAKRP